MHIQQAYPYINHDDQNQSIDFLSLAQYLKLPYSQSQKENMHHFRLLHIVSQDIEKRTVKDLCHLETGYRRDWTIHGTIMCLSDKKIFVE